MRVLLDECLPRKLRWLLPGHQVSTAVEAGAAGRRNGDLLRLAEAGFDVLLTADRNLSFQQDLRRYNIAVVVLAAPSNAIEELEPLMPEVLRRLPALAGGHMIVIAAQGSEGGGTRRSLHQL